MVAGQVETADLSGVLKGHKEAISPGAYQRHTQRTRPDAALSELAKDVAKGEATQLSKCHAMMGALADAIEYTPGETDAGTTAAEALASGKGVCQDHAHAFVAAARALGYPARYVSGYLLMENTVNQDATHAWAEAWVEHLGWVGFDISNGISPDERYVRLAIGLDYREAAPISGVRFGGGAEHLDVSLQVQAQQ